MTDKYHEKRPTSHIWNMMNNGRWVLQNLETKGPMKWKPNPLYKPIFDTAFAADKDRPHKRHVILKARRMYMTSHIMVASMCLASLRSSLRNAFINHGKDAGMDLLQQMGGYIATNSDLGFECELVSNKLRIFHKGHPPSIIEAILNFRSMTGNLAHYTDFAKMSLDFPVKAQESLSGTLGSMPHGWVFIESTAAGRIGQFAQICNTAIQMKEEGITPSQNDFMIWFFPWYERSENVLNIESRDPKRKLHKELDDYFKQMAHLNWSPEQKWWYENTWVNAPISMNWTTMYSEHPSTIEEAFSANTEAMFIANEMNRAMQTGRIGDFGDNGKPVNVAFDFGKTAYTVMLFFQENDDGGIRFIDFYKNRNETLSHYISMLERKGYSYGRLILPHDARSKGSDYINYLTDKSDMSIVDYFAARGWRNCDVIEKIKSKEFGFSESKEFVTVCRFHERACRQMIDDLTQVRRKEVGDLLMSEVERNECTDTYDAFEQAARWWHIRKNSPGIGKGWLNIIKNWDGTKMKRAR